MPTYTYLCKECDVPFEEVRSMNDLDRPAPCPECGGGDTHRIISAPAVVIDWRDSDSLARTKRFRTSRPSQILRRSA